MTYTLERLAPGSFDIVLDGEVIGALVKNGAHSTSWTAELLTEAPAGERPAPFVDVEHTFAKLDDVLLWLGRPGITAPQKLMNWGPSALRG